jgi:hypothetical protein
MTIVASYTTAPCNNKRRSLQHQNHSRQQELQRVHQPQNLHNHKVNVAASRQLICVKLFACFVLCLFASNQYIVTNKLSEHASRLCHAEETIAVSTIFNVSTFAGLEVSNISSSSLSLPVASQNNVNISRLPIWFHEYVQFHNEAIQELSRNSSNYVNYKYLLLRCLKKDASGNSTCFGASDRLKMVPVMLKFAYQFRRIFFIYWEHPFPIEEFLLPNYNVLNWSLPHYLLQPLNVEAITPLWYFYFEREKGMNEGTRVIRMKAMVNAGFHYNLLRVNDTEGIPIDEPPLSDVYGDFWRALFVPSPGVRNSIQNTLRDLELLASSTREGGNTLFARETTHSDPLIPNIHVKPYISVHIRANHFQDKSHVHLEENALRCAIQLNEQYVASVDKLNGRTPSLNQSLPIYIASDTKVIIDRAKQFAYDQHQLQVVSRNYTSTPYHIDHPPAGSTTNETLQASDFYDTFVDLYILSMGQCFTYGVGGFGSWPAEISYFPTKNDICRSIDHNLLHC